MTAASTVSGLLIVVILTAGAGLLTTVNPTAAAATMIAIVIATAGIALRAFLQDAIRLLRTFHWLWLLLFLSSLTWRERTTSSAADNPLDGLALLRVVLVVVAFGLLLASLSIKKDKLSIKAVSGFLALFAAVNLVSSVWSVNVTWTLYKSFEYAVGIFALILVAGRLKSIEDYKRLFDLAWLLLGLVLASVFVWLVIDPGRVLITGLGTLGFGLQGALPVVYRNGLGEIAGILSLVSLSRLLTRERLESKYLVLFVLTGIVLVVTQTRSALLGALLGGVLIIILTRRFSWLVLAVPLALVIAFATTADQNFESYLERDPRLRPMARSLSTCSSSRRCWRSSAPSRSRTSA